MKIIIIFVFFIFTSISFGQDFTCPKEVNFGDFVIVDSASRISPKLQYVVSFKAVKNTDDLIYIDSKLDILYDSIIVTNGNEFFNSGSQFYKDTIQFYFLITPIYFDELSQKGKYLEAKFTFYYRHLGAYNLDSQEVSLKYRLIQDKKLIANNINNQQYKISLKKYYNRQNDYSSFMSYVYNNTNKIFVIDSIGQSIKGINFFSFGRRKNDTLPLPLELPSGKFFHFYHNYKLLQPEHSQSIISIYGHFKNSQEELKLRDTISVIFDYIDSLIVSSFSRKFYYYSVYNIDTSRIPIIYISNFQDSLVLFKRMEVSNLDNLNLFFVNESGFESPYLFASWEGKRLKTFYIVPTEKKKYKVNIEFYFEDSKGKEFKRELEFIINAIEKPVTDIKDRTYKDNNLSITPNPARDYIEIHVGDGMLKGAVKVYNVLGVEMLTQDSRFRGNDMQVLRLDVSGLPAGVYFVRVGGRMLKFVKM